MTRRCPHAAEGRDYCIVGKTITKADEDTKRKSKRKIFVCKFLSQDGTENTEAVKRQIGITRANAGTK